MRGAMAWWLGGLLVAATAAPVAAAQPEEAPQPAEQTLTGNDWIDARLRDMDAYAARYRDAFVDELVRYHDAPRALVEEALADGALAPGEIYLACALAKATGRVCREVIEARRAEPEADWATLAERLGTTPDAALYRRIRSDITESYARWARPLESGATNRP